MKKTIKLISFCLAVIMIILAVIPITAFAAESKSTVESETITVENYTIHNITDNTGYYVSNSNKVSTLSSGHTRLGTLKVSGKILKKTYNGFEAYAVYGGDISFQYKQTWSNKTYQNNEWKLSSDSATSINGVSTGSIGDGGILIMKSFDDGATWTKAATTVSINGDTVTFTPDGKDIQRGVMYKFISVCEGYYTYVSGTHKEWVFWPFKSKTVTDYADYFENFAQQSIVYVASDSAEVGFYSKATDNYDLSDAFDDVSAETLEILKRGTTLSHNSVSFDQIRVDKLGNSSFDVVCSFNDCSYFTVDDGEIFSEPGRYHFKITTKFLTQRELDIYILKPGDDMAYSQYFGDSFVSQDKRMFDKSSPIPVYMVGSILNVDPAENVPGLYGHVYRYADAAAVERDEYEIIHTFTAQTKATTVLLEKTGIYCADLFAGDPNACGEIIHYGFYFAIAENEDYKPSVNLEMLSSADRHVMLKTSGYAVNFATAGGGSYVFMFPTTSDGYASALAFSEAIEYRFIEEYTDSNGAKYYYYKAHGTSGLKERFDSKVELYAAVINYAKDNVNITYTNNTEAYATMTMDEAVANIENTSIKNDVKVCIDSQTRDKLVSNDIILNGYEFYQVAEYETSSVTATSEDGKIYTIPYGVALDTVLPGTGRYLISETNWGGTINYYANYLADGDVTGSISYVAYKNYEEFSGKLNSSTQNAIEANAITLVSANDKYDTQSIVTIARVGERKNMLLSEVNGYTISEPGIYHIIITNRCGYTTTATVKITPAPEIAIKFSDNEQWNRSVKYGEALGELPMAERYGYVFLGWKVNGELVTSTTKCTWAHEVVLTPCFEPRAVTIIFNYFGGYSMVTANYGETVKLPECEDISGFQFGYWALDGSEIDSLSVNTLDTIVLVANYYEYNEETQDVSDVAYAAYDLAPKSAQRPPKSSETTNDECEAPNTSGDLSADTESAAEEIESADSEVNDAIESNAEDSTDESSNNIGLIILIACICALALIAIVIAIIRRIYW